jgi:hypothetical protein
MERPLHTPALKPIIAEMALEQGDVDVDASVLYSQIVIDSAGLARNIRHALQERSHITLCELCEAQPLKHGLAELVAYLHLAGDTCKAVVDEDTTDIIVWRGIGANGVEQTKQACLPRVIFVR